MASTSIDTMIIFIASILVAVSVSAVFTTEVLSMADASRDSAEDLSEKIRSDITIINDRTNVPYDDTNGDGTNDSLVFYVKNTGSSTSPVDPDLFTVLIDGQFEDVSSVSLIQGSGSWSPGEVVRLNVSAEGLSGDHTVKIDSRSSSDTIDIRLG
ncbi:flagellar protein G [Halorutilales archaeon Cl-col2-1]